ncbi:cobalamin-independent methionine synthase catalytic subunit [Stackebrandtia endophytica]|uniref:Cobalamin-independent methionine synthase catalytic subunit n=1 Tax=Stackebrandtia endophytica TaxID=1496996 RepID=A0A543ARQ8_9ACTN|nr:methionine synthase [Stackebrandtia endophytica]TQL75270.1 cobalamin-independent methionine synthase catalytic subunit [Stackebrandtia endophytica]
MTVQVLPAGVATGIGSLPGTDVVEAVRLVMGELPDFPHLPELPARGPGADLIGRGASLLVDIPVQLYAGRWQVASRGGMDLRRGRDLLERDLDALTDVAGDHDGPLKVSAAGPWTLAASLDRQVGGALLRDPGAVFDLTQSLAEGLAAHLGELAARLPHARLVVQLDEPWLPAVLAGEVATESGFSRYRAVESETVRDRLAAIVSAVSVPVVVHCCAAEVPVTLIRDAGANAVAVDMSLIDLDSAAHLDPLGEALEAGFGLFAGIVATGPGGDSLPSGQASIDPVNRLWNRLGLPADRRREQVVTTPACGLAGRTPAEARAVMRACVEAAKWLTD